MSHADDGKACIAQTLGVTPLLTVWYGIAYIGEVLMTVGTYQLMIALAVEPEAILALELKTAYSYLGKSPSSDVLPLFMRDARR